MNFFPSFPRNRLHFRQQVAEFAVIDFHAVVQVQGDAHVGIMAEFIIEFGEFGLFLFEHIDFFLEFALVRGGGGGFLFIIQKFDAGADIALQRGDIEAAHPGQGGFIIAVEIDQAFKGLLLAAGKQPVDGAFFIGFEMVFEKAGAQISADGVDGVFAAFGV